MAHICDVNAERPAGLGLFQRNRIVEVLGGCTIDGEGEGFAQIDAAGNVLGIDFLRQRGGCGQHVLREFLVQLVLTDQGLDVGADVVLVAQHFDHAAARASASLAPLRHAHDDLIVVLRAAAVVTGNINVGGDAALVRHHIGRRTVGFKRAHDHIIGVGQHANDLALTAFGIDDAHKKRIAVQRAVHRVRGNEYILYILFFGNQKAKAARISLKPSAQQPQRFGQSVALLAGLEQAAFFRHGFQQLIGLGRADMGQFRHLLRSARAAFGQQRFRLILPFHNFLCIHLFYLLSRLFCPKYSTAAGGITIFPKRKQSGVENPPLCNASWSFLAGKALQDEQHQAQHHEHRAGNFGQQFQLAFVAGGLLLAEEGFRTAGDGTGKTGRLALLHEHQHNQTQAINSQDDAENDANHIHLEITSQTLHATEPGFVTALEIYHISARFASPFHAKSLFHAGKRTGDGEGA